MYKRQLQGRGHARLFLDSLPLGHASLQRLEIEPGPAIPFPGRGPSDEVAYVLAGRATMTAAGRSENLGPDDAVRLPAGLRQILTVSERLIALQCYAPAGPEQRYKKR